MIEYYGDFLNMNNIFILLLLYTDTGIINMRKVRLVHWRDFLHYLDSRKDIVWQKYQIVVGMKYLNKYYYLRRAK